MPDLVDFSISLEGERQFNRISSVCHSVEPWQTDDELGQLEVSTSYVPVSHWEGAFTLPPIFEKKNSKGGRPHLTNADAGLFRQVTELNLSEFAAFLIDSGEFMEVGEQLAYYQYPCWHLLSSQRAQKEISMLLEDHNGEYLSPYQLAEIAKRIKNSSKIQHLVELPDLDYHILCCRDGLYQWPICRINHSMQRLWE